MAWATFFSYGSAGSQKPRSNTRLWLGSKAPAPKQPGADNHTSAAKPISERRDESINGALPR